MSETNISESETSAKIMGLHPSEIEDNVVDQVRKTANSKAFTGDIRIMPDCHWGSGATIGFTMPIDTETIRVVPNTIGVDIGCGLLAGRLDGVGMQRLRLGDTVLFGRMDDLIRDAVPMGRSVHESTEYHFGENFPWENCTERWQRAKDRLDLEDPEWFDEYGLDSYFKPLCDRVEYDPMRAINSMGTLGGGNHFIEICETDFSDYWVVIHSGSRGIGYAIADHWQTKAIQNRMNEWIQENIPEELEKYIVPDLDSDDLAMWFEGGMGQSYIDSDAIKSDVDNNYLVGYLHDQIRTAHPQNADLDEDLAYLEEDSAAGYLVDMIFAQEYASENRLEMLGAITESCNIDCWKTIHSPHNLIDFDDLVLRKGATSAHDGEEFVLPFNMADGTFICEGKGNSEWNNSAPHGAGRVMSRTQAKSELDVETFEEQMSDIYSSSVSEATLDEAPDSYKDASMIENAIEETASIKYRLKPLLNMKAHE